MKIIVVSDSHGASRELKKVMELHPDADIVIHCGDSRDEVSDIMRAYPGHEYHCVRGNCDFDCPFPLTDVFTADGVKFMVTHGHMYGVKYDMLRLHKTAQEHGVDVVCYGHTHVPHDELVDGVRLFNPGSIGYGKTFGVIEIQNGQVLSNLAVLK